MSLEEKRWWKKLFGGGKKEPKIDTIENIEAIKEFLSESNVDRKFLLKELEKLEELEKEREVARPGIVQVNLDTQAAVLENILERYEFFLNDTNINGIRLKMVANQFLKNAEKEGMHDLVKEKKKDMKWLMQW